MLAMGVICSSVVDVKKVARQDVNAPKEAFVVGRVVAGPKSHVSGFIRRYFSYARVKTDDPSGG